MYRIFVVLPVAVLLSFACSDKRDSGNVSNLATINLNSPEEFEYDRFELHAIKVDQSTDPMVFEFTSQEEIDASVKPGSYIFRGKAFQKGQLIASSEVDGCFENESRVVAGPNQIGIEICSTVGHDTDFVVEKLGSATANLDVSISYFEKSPFTENEVSVVCENETYSFSIVEEPDLTQGDALHLKQQGSNDGDGVEYLYYEHFENGVITYIGPQAFGGGAYWVISFYLDDKASTIEKYSIGTAPDFDFEKVQEDSLMEFSGDTCSFYKYES
jgi:hypothetical protein